MTNSKTKISASYRAIFILSIFMVFIVLIEGAATKSKGSGIGMFIWGYTAWLMYKRRVSDLVSFYKGLLWFDVIAAGVALAVLAFSDNDATRYVGYSTIDATLLFALVISLTYGLYRYFLNLQNNPVDKSVDENTKSSIENVNEVDYETAYIELKTNTQREGLWAMCLANSNGDENRAKAEYIKKRVLEIRNFSSVRENQNTTEDKAEIDIKIEVNKFQSEYNKDQPAEDNISDGRYTLTKTWGFDCLLFENGQAALKVTDKIYRLYENNYSLEKSLQHYKKKSIYLPTGFLREIEITKRF